MLKAGVTEYSVSEELARLYTDHTCTERITLPKDVNAVRYGAANRQVKM